MELPPREIREMILPRLLSRSLLSVFVCIFVCVSLSLFLSLSFSTFAGREHRCKRGNRRTTQANNGIFHLPRICRDARRTHTSARVFCNNHVDFCFTERGGSRNRIRMNFVPANVPLFCIFYCCSSINEFKTETRARVFLLWISARGRLDGDPF